MKKKFSSFKGISQKGFSLPELMVAIAIVGIVLVAMAGVFVRSSRLYTTENVKAALQGEMRAALEIMSREIHMAGLDPLRTGNFDIQDADATRIRFNMDLDGDGVTNPSFTGGCEAITLRYSAGVNNAVQIVCGEGYGATSTPQSLIGGATANVQVTGLDFDYRDSAGNPTSFIPDMRGVIITLTAEAPAGRDGMISREYQTWVDFRNAAPNATI